jgi:mannose-1-phosphate guanylyltransferase
MMLSDGQSLLSKTFARAAGLEHVSKILTVTNRELLFATENEYRSISARRHRQSYILEPLGRNTAAAVAAAALQLHGEHGDDALMLVMAADHLILDEEAFAAAVASAVDLAHNGWLVTFGVKPESAETGFGYIEAHKGGQLKGGLRVRQFVEKPDAATAAAYVRAGNFYWNAGMFCFRIGTVVEQLQAHACELLQAVREVLDVSNAAAPASDYCLELDRDAFAKVPDISIDYALMERSEKVATVPCDIGWSDIGSWSAVSELTPADPHGNRLEGEVVTYAASNNYVHSESRLTALAGVENLLVIDTPDALLIADKEHAQDVRHIVDQLKREGHATRVLHQTVHRPWGTYTTLECGERFKIKRIVVKPKASLSLQMHHHRSEHWVVVSGTARVINNHQELLLHTNESTFIPAGHMHRLHNPGVIDLVLIEVQSGDYLGEDDIVRLEDDFGRACRE